MKAAVCILLAGMAVAQSRAQDDLPKHAPGETFDFEPKLMLDGPHANVVPDAPPAMSPADRVKQLEADLLSAEQHAAGCEQLYKDGILAKVEVEGRQMRVVQITKQLADARADAAAAQADAVKKNFDARKASQADLDAAHAALAAARQAAKGASAEWDKAQLNAATIDLQRKRKLYSEGVATRLEVQMAEDRLALLTGTLAKPAASP
jgi:hypothetical protein